MEKRAIFCWIIDGKVEGPSFFLIAQSKKEPPKKVASTGVFLSFLRCEKTKMERMLPGLSGG